MGLSSDHSVSPDTVVRQRGLTLKGLPFPTTRRPSAEQTQTTRVTDATTTTLSSVVVSSLPPTALNQQFPLQVRSQSVSRSHLRRRISEEDDRKGWNPSCISLGLPLINRF